MGILRSLARFAFLLLLAAVAVAHAQSYEPESAPQYTSEPGLGDPQLDQMLAPIALYPDELLAQVLMAATYPLEVVEAARWSRAHPDMQGQDAVAAVDDRDWDPSVKSLVAFPNVLAMMDEQLDWTQRLGEAFLGQQGDVMRSVQRLRRAALDQGNLASTDEMVVTREGTEIALDSPSPEIVYVPYYDPRVVYGPWWWPSYPPLYWGPWPGYYVGGYGFAWGLGIPVGMDFFYGDFDWHRHHVRIDHHPFYYHGRDHRPIYSHDREWRHDPHHRRDVPYRNPAARRDFAGTHAPRPVREDRRSARASSQIAPTQPGAVQPLAPREGASPIARPSTPQQGYFPAQPQREVRPAPRAAEPQRSVVPGGAAPRPVYPSQAVRPSEGVRPQSSTPQVARPPAAQPLARSAPQPQVVVPHPAPPAVAPQPGPPVVHSAPAPAPPARSQGGGSGSAGQGADSRLGPRDR